MSDDVRADARRLLQDITPGPWSVDYENSDCYPYERYAYAITGPRNTGLDVPHVSDEYRAQYGNQMSEIVGISDADAEFIAAAPALVQRLLAELDGKDGEIAELNGELGARDCDCVDCTDAECAAIHERDAALAVIAQVRDLAADVDQDGGHSGPSLARTILNIIGGEA